MLWRRFWALSQAIDRLEAQQDLRALDVAAIGANPGTDGKAVRTLQKHLRVRCGVEKPGRRDEGKPLLPLLPGLTPGVAFEAQPGSIEAERQRQKAANERLRREWEAQRQRMRP